VWLERSTIAYCRIGERSSHTWFALTYLLGFDNARTTVLSVPNPFPAGNRRVVVDSTVTTTHPSSHQEQIVPWDYLVIAVGNVVNLARLPGVAQHGLPIKTIGDALAIRNRTLEMLDAAENTPDAGYGSQSQPGGHPHRQGGTGQVVVCDQDQGRIEDAAGKLYVFATTTCVIRRAGTASSGPAL